MPVTMPRILTILSSHAAPGPRVWIAVIGTMPSGPAGHGRRADRAAAGLAALGGGRRQRAVEVRDVVAGVLGAAALAGEAARAARRLRHARALAVRGGRARGAERVDHRARGIADLDAAGVRHARAVDHVALRGERAQRVGEHVRLVGGQRRRGGHGRSRARGPGAVGAPQRPAADVDRRGSGVADLDHLVVTAAGAAEGRLRDHDGRRVRGGCRHRRYCKEDGCCGRRDAQFHGSGVLSARESERDGRKPIVAPDGWVTVP